MTVCVVGDLGPACVNLTRIRGGDKNEMVLNLKVGGVPVDVTGMILSAQARKKSTDPDPAPITAVISVIGDPANGSLDIRWPGAQVTAALDGDATWKGVWDLQQITGGDDPVTIVAGTFGAEQDVTR